MGTLLAAISKLIFVWIPHSILSEDILSSASDEQWCVSLTIHSYKKLGTKEIIYVVQLGESKIHLPCRLVEPILNNMLLRQDQDMDDDLTTYDKESLSTSLCTNESTKSKGECLMDLLQNEGTQMLGEL